MNGLVDFLAKLALQVPLCSFTSAWLFVHLLAGLVACFLGYLIYRAEAVFFGFAAGGCFGTMLVGLLIPDSPGWLYLLAAVCFSIPVGAGAWFFYRAYLAGVLFVLTTLVFLLLVAWPASAADWVFGLIFGVGFGVLAYLFAKHLIVLMNALSGAFLALTCAAVIVARGPDRLWELTVGPEGHVWLAGVLVGVGLGISAAGAYVQYRLSAKLSAALSEPQPSAKGASRKRRPAVA